VGRNAKMALAVGIGYLLGRRRKLRTALTLGAAAAVGRLSTDPQAMLRQGSKLLGASPQLGQAAGLGKPLATAGKAAAAAAVSHGIDSVGDRMRRKADALRGFQEGGAAEEGRAAQERGPEPETERRRGRETEDEYIEREEAEPEQVEPEEAAAEPEPRRPARPRAARPSTGARARRRPAEDETGEAQPSAERRTPSERPATGGAPVRRRGR
jgi:hypothetical protein